MISMIKRAWRKITGHGERTLERALAESQVRHW